MKTMKQCLGCKGLVPASLEACPNCAVTPRSPGSKSGLKKVVGLVALMGAGATSCVPVYGAPCALAQLDGGKNGCFGQCDTLLEDGGSPAKDPQNECFVPDGGTP